MDRKQAETYLRERKPDINRQQMEGILGRNPSDYLVDPNRIVSSQAYEQLLSQASQARMTEKSLRQSLKKRGSFVEGLDLEATPFDDLSVYDIHSIALSNLFGSAKDVAVNTAKALVDPKTYKAIAQLGGEAARKAAYYSRRSIEGYDALASAETAEGAPETPLLDTMTDFYAKTYNIGSEEGRRNLVRYYALDPASILADIAPLVGGSAAVAAKVTRAGSAANKVLGAVRKTARLADATNYPFLVARGLVPPVKWTANKAKDAGKRVLDATPAPVEFAAWVGEVGTAQAAGAYHQALVNPTDAFMKAMRGEPGYGFADAFRLFDEGLRSYDKSVNNEYRRVADALSANTQEVPGSAEAIRGLMRKLQGEGGRNYKLNLDPVRDLYASQQSAWLRSPSEPEFRWVRDRVFENPRYVSVSDAAKSQILQSIVALVDEAETGGRFGQGIPAIDGARTASRWDDIKIGLGKLAHDNASLFPDGTLEKTVMQEINRSVSDLLKDKVKRGNGFAINYAEELADPYAKKMKYLKDIKKEFAWDIDKPSDLQPAASRMVRNLGKALGSNDPIRKELMDTIQLKVGGRMMDTLAGGLLAPKVPTRIATMMGGILGLSVVRAGLVGKLFEPVAFSLLALSIPRVSGEFYVQLGKFVRKGWGLPGAALDKVTNNRAARRINQMSRYMVDTVANSPFGQIAARLNAGQNIPAELLEAHSSLVRYIREGKEREAVALMLNISNVEAAELLAEHDQILSQSPTSTDMLPAKKTARSAPKAVPALPSAAMPTSGTPALDLLQQQPSP